MRALAAQRSERPVPFVPDASSARPHPPQAATITTIIIVIIIIIIVTITIIYIAITSSYYQYC